MDLKNVTGRCTVSIGRPLDEVIRIRVESSSLNCRNSKILSNANSDDMISNPTRVQSFCVFVPTGEFVAFFDRLAFVRKCEQVAGTELTSRTNVLLVRQNVQTAGSGVLFTYSSQKNTKKSLHRGKNSIRLCSLCWAFNLLLKVEYLLAHAHTFLTECELMMLCKLKLVNLYIYSSYFAIGLSSTSIDMH